MRTSKSEEKYDNLIYYESFDRYKMLEMCKLCLESISKHLYSK